MEKSAKWSYIFLCMCVGKQYLASVVLYLSTPLRQAITKGHLLNGSGSKRIHCGLMIPLAPSRGSRSHVVCPSSGEFYWTEKKLSFNSSAVSFPFLLDWKWAGLRKSFFLNRKSPLQTLWTPSWYMLLHQLWLRLIIRCTQCLEIAFSSNPKKSCLYPSLWGIYSAYLKSLGLIQILVFEMSWWTQRPPLCFDHHQVFVIFA